MLPAFLASLPEGMAGLDWRLVVADNDSADSTVDLIRSLAPEATVVQTGRNAGYAAGVNAALGAAAAWEGGFRAALVCNPDVRMRQGCAALLLDALGAAAPGGGRVGISVPLLYEEDGRTLLHSLRRESRVTRALGEAVIGNRRAGRFPRWSELVTDPTAYERATVADWATGALMALSRECLDACGAWDESFFLYSEETEYCLRARDRGFVTRLEPAAAATHLGGDSQVSPRLWTLLTLNRVRLYGQPARGGGDGRLPDCGPAAGGLTCRPRPPRQPGGRPRPGQPVRAARHSGALDRANGTPLTRSLISGPGACTRTGDHGKGRARGTARGCGRCCAMRRWTRQ